MMDEGVKQYVLIYQQDDNRSRSSALRPESHSELFNKILTAILTSEDKSVAQTEAVNMVLDPNRSAAKRKGKLAVGDAEEMIDVWISQHLLNLNADGDKLTLGFVAVAEFDHFIKTHYPDAYVLCPACDWLCLTGVTCCRCQGKTHIRCSKSNEMSQSSDFVCIKCRQMTVQLSASFSRS